MQKHHGRRVRYSKAAWFMVAEKSAREEGAKGEILTPTSYLSDPGYPNVCSTLWMDVCSSTFGQIPKSIKLTFPTHCHSIKTCSIPRAASAPFLQKYSVVLFILLLSVIYFTRLLCALSHQTDKDSLCSPCS